VWLLTGANSYTSGTTISAGTLQVGNGGATGNLGTGGVTDNGTLAYDRSNSLTEANFIKWQWQYQSRRHGHHHPDGDQQLHRRHDD